MEMNGPIEVNYNGGSIESRTVDSYGYIMTETVKWDDGSEIIVGRDADATHPAFYHDEFQDRSDHNFPGRENMRHLGAPGVLMLWIALVTAIIIMICSWKCRNWVRNQVQNNTSTTS